LKSLTFLVFYVQKIVVKYPFPASDQTIEEAIKAKKIGFCTIDPTEYAGESDKRITHIEIYTIMFICIKWKASYILQRESSVILSSTQKDFKNGIV
jgi:hypothetical protein